MKIIDKETKTESLLKEIIKSAIGGVEAGEEIMLEHPGNDVFGDYSTNVALNLAKTLKQPPRKIAEEIVEKINHNQAGNEILDKVEVAGAGFINFFLKTDYLVKIAADYNDEEKTKENLSSYGIGKSMIIDYSAPNIAKPFGIGHLRSTNIGQAIYNIYKALGWKTIGDNHLGDWGTQFGKLIVAIKKWGEKPVEEMTIEDLEKLYVKFHQEAENDESLVEEARATFAKLEEGDPEIRDYWQKCINLSLKEFDRIYKILGVKIDLTNGESFYEKMLPQTIEDVKKKGIVKESQGAEIVEFQNMPPAMILKSNQTTTYFTRDLATIKYRMETFKPDLIVYEVGNDHILYFNQVFETAKMMGWEPNNGFVHVAHGMIRWKNGKFSTREGKTIHMEEVLDKAYEEAEKVSNNSQVEKVMTEDEKEKMIKAVAVGAIKFTDLSQDPKKDIIFDWERIMSLEGDSGPYLQYTWARSQSVMLKSGKKIENAELPSNVNSEEISLIREFYKFEEKIVDSANRFNPSIIAEYLLSLARKYNEFYNKHRIVGEPEEEWRLFLTKTTANILESGLKLLGIETVERM